MQLAIVINMNFDIPEDWEQVSGPSEPQEARSEIPRIEGC